MEKQLCGASRYGKETMGGRGYTIRDVHFVVRTCGRLIWVTDTLSKIISFLFSWLHRNYIPSATPYGIRYS